MPGSRTTGDPLSVDAAISRISEKGTGRWTVLCVFTLSINACVQALETNMLTFLVPCAGAGFEVAESRQSRLFSCVYAGLIVGALLITPLADLFGRYPVLKVTVWLLLLFGLASAAAPTFTLLATFRFFVGIAEGAWTISLDLLSESVPTDTRGFLVNISNLGWGIGSASICMLSWAIIPHYGWRPFCVAAAIPVALCALLLSWLTESPHWLLYNSRNEEAVEALAYMASINGCEPPCCQLLAPPKTESSDLLSQTTSEDNLQNYILSQTTSEDKLQSYTQLLSKMFNEYRMLLSPRHITLTLPVWTLWACWGIAYPGIVLFDGIVLGQETGATSTCSFDYEFVFLLSFGEVLGSAIILPFIDQDGLGWLGGRRGTQMLAFLGCAVTTRIAATRATNVFPWALASRACVMAASSASVVQVPELYETNVRATATGAANVVSLIGGMLAPTLVYSLTKENLSLIIMVLCLVAALCLLVLPETARRDLDDLRAGSRADGTLPQ